MLETYTYKLEGVCPLLMHNGQLADPLNKHTKSIKEVSSKRKKTDEDFEELARREWLGGLYLNEDDKLILPADLLLASLIGGAKKSKLGKQFAPAVFIDKDPLLKIGDSRPARELWEDGRYVDTRGVKVSMSRVMRTRPRFDKWSLTVDCLINPTIVDPPTVLRAWEDAGQMIGLGDYRPRFGRFNVEAI